MRELAMRTSQWVAKREILPLWGSNLCASSQKGAQGSDARCRATSDPATDVKLEGWYGAKLAGRGGGGSAPMVRYASSGRTGCSSGRSTLLLTMHRTNSNSCEIMAGKERSSASSSTCTAGTAVELDEAERSLNLQFVIADSQH